MKKQPVKKKKKPAKNLSDLTLPDKFNVLLWVMLSDCGNKKQFMEFKAALKEASMVLHKGKGV